MLKGWPRSISIKEVKHKLQKKGLSLEMGKYNEDTYVTDILSDSTLDVSDMELQSSSEKTIYEKKVSKDEDGKEYSLQQFANKRAAKECANSNNNTIIVKHKKRYYCLHGFEKVIPVWKLHNILYHKMSLYYSFPSMYYKGEICGIMELYLERPPQGKHMVIRLGCSKAQNVVRPSSTSTTTPTEVSTSIQQERANEKVVPPQEETQLNLPEINATQTTRTSNNSHNKEKKVTTTRKQLNMPELTESPKPSMLHLLSASTYASLLMCVAGCIASKYLCQYSSAMKLDTGSWLFLSDVSGCIAIAGAAQYCTKGDAKKEDGSALCTILKIGSPAFLVLSASLCYIGLAKS